MEGQSAVGVEPANGHTIDMVGLSLRVPRRWNKALKQYALDHETSVNEIVRGLIERFVEEHRLLK